MLWENKNIFINEAEWKREDSLWIQKSNIKEESTFEKCQADKIHEYEDSSWWYLYRRSLLENILEKYFDKSGDVVDIGGGNGFIASGLQEKGFRVNIIEPSLASCQYAQERGVRNIYCGMINETSIKDDSLPQVLLCDVLEHIESDKLFLELILKKLIPGGKLLITVPAFQSLWSSEDVASGHYRRYTIEQVTRLLESCAHGQYEILYKNYFFGFLYFPVLIVRVIFERIGVLKKVEERTKEEFDEVQDKEYVNTNRFVKKVLSALEKKELNNIINEKSIRRGSSLFIIVKRKEV